LVTELRIPWPFYFIMLAQLKKVPEKKD